MKNQQPAIVPHITPLRIRSTSRENHHQSHNNSYASSVGNGNKIFGDPNGLDYIGLRINKDHASCNNHHLTLPPPAQSTMHSTRPQHHRLDISPNMLSRNQYQQQTMFNLQHPTISQTVVQSPQNQQLMVVDPNTLLNNVNSEFQRFLDVDLRQALNDMKNQMFEQQFGFERQVCQHLDKLQQDFENQIQQIPKQPDINTSLFDPSKHNYANQEDLKIIEDDLKSLTKQLEDSLNKHSQDVQQTFDTQQQAIEHLSLAQAQQNEQQAEVNSDIQNQFKVINNRFQSIKDHNQQQDNSIDKMIMSIDQLKDEMQLQVKKLKNEQQNGLTDLSDNLTKKLNDQDKSRQYDHDLFKKRLDDLNQKFVHDINHQKLEDLEKLIRSQDNLQVIIDLRKRVQELEDEVSNIAIKNERDLKSTADKLKFDFDEDQKRQDRITQQLSQDCDFKFENSNKFIEKVNLEKTQQINDVGESLAQFKKLFKEDQIRQDNDIEGLKNIMGDFQGMPKTDKALEQKLLSLEEELTNHMKKQKANQSSQQEALENHSQKLQENKKTQDNMQNEISQLQKQLKQLPIDIDKKLEQESKLQSHDIQRLEKKLGLDLDNAIQQIDENIQLLNDNQTQLQSNMQQQFEDQSQLQEQQDKKINDNLKHLQDNLAKLQKDVDMLKLSKPDENGKINQDALEMIRQNLQNDIEQLQKEQLETQEQLNNLSEDILKLYENQDQQSHNIDHINQEIQKTQNQIKGNDKKQTAAIQNQEDQLQDNVKQINDKIDGLQNIIDQDAQKQQQLQEQQQLESQKKQLKNVEKLQSQNYQQQIDSIILDIEQLKDNQQQDEQIQQLQSQLEELEAKNLNLINDIQDQILKIDENTQNNLQNIADQVNNFVNDVDAQIKILGDNDETHLENTNQLQEQINQLQLKEQVQDQRLDNLEQKLQTTDQKILEVKENLQQDLDNFKDNICKDFEFMEEQVVGALQNDTVGHIHKTQVAPLEVRVYNLEKDKNMEVSQVFEQNIIKTPPKLTKEEQEEQMHQKLLSEMKRRRLWYLRKTPQDYIIEEIMLKHRCTQAKAEQIYLKQLEKNKLIKESPEGSRSRSLHAGTNETTNSNFLGIKHIYENIIHAASPSRSGSRAQEISHLEEGKERVSATNVMRQPYSPYKGDLKVEPDYEEGRNLSHSPLGQSQNAPYIVIKSPMHEETVQTIEIVPINKKKKQQQQLTNAYNPNINPSQLTTTNPTKRQAQTIDISDMDDDFIEESNIDIDELDGNVSQMRQNLDNIIESPNQQRETRGRRRENNLSVNFSREGNMPNVRGFNDTQQFLNQIERYSPTRQPIKSARQNNKFDLSTPLNQNNPTQSAFKIQTQPFNMDYSSQEPYNTNVYKQVQAKTKTQGKAQVQMVEETWGSGDKSSKNNDLDQVFIPQHNNNINIASPSQFQKYQSQGNQNNNDINVQLRNNKSSIYNTNKSQVNEFVVDQNNHNNDSSNDQNNTYNIDHYNEPQQLQHNTHNNKNYFYDDDQDEENNQQPQQQQQQEYYNENDEPQQYSQQYDDQNYDDDNLQQLQQQEYYDEEQDGSEYSQQDQYQQQDIQANNNDLSYAGSFQYDYQENIRAQHERDSIPQQYQQQQFGTQGMQNNYNDNNDNIFIQNQQRRNN